MSKRAAIKTLLAGAIDVVPIDFDWSDDHNIIGDAWDYACADRCDKCGEIVAGNAGESVQHRDVDCDSDCEGYLSLPGPMMSYWYPVGDLGDMQEVAKTLVDSPLCVVEVGGTTGLALTGGGMDLSWEICEAFMMLGLLPPLHFAELPGMAGRGTSRRDRWIIAGCLKTCVVAAQRAHYKAKRLRETARWARERETKQAAEV